MSSRPRPRSGARARCSATPRSARPWRASSSRATSTPAAWSDPADNPIVAVADLRTLKLEAGVSELDAGRLKVGALARVTVSAQPGEVFEGRVAAVAPEVDPRNRHFRVEIRVANKGGAMLSGMYATARIVDASADGLIVPREAVFDRNGGRAVYRVDGDTVSIVPVTEGLSDGKRSC